MNLQKTKRLWGGLRQFENSRSIDVQPRKIYRTAADYDDHNVVYDAIISNRALYGNKNFAMEDLTAPTLPRKQFRDAFIELFDKIRSGAFGDFDYVIVDTRGGFSFHTTDVCALADSFIVVTEADYTSFHQDRNLVHRIAKGAQSMNTNPLLRGIIINKAIEGVDDRMGLRSHREKWQRVEENFRNALTREFPLDYDDTYAFPLDDDAIISYKKQKIPYVSSPHSLFSYATLLAFGQIMGVVTQQWPADIIERWNGLVRSVKSASDSWVEKEMKIIEERQADGRRLHKIEEEYREILREKETLEQRAQYENALFEEKMKHLKTGGNRLARRVRSTRRSSLLVGALTGVFLTFLGLWAIENYYDPASFELIEKTD